MNRLFSFIIVYFVCITNILGQINSICNETFEGTLNGWTNVPTYSWMPNTNLYVSGQKSYVGYVPAINGDSVMLTTPYFDLTNYAHVILKFNHICKVSKSDICQIEYKESYTGAIWHNIPTSTYFGSGIYTNALFHDSSYSIWQPTNLLAIPTNSWWQNETFDISDEVSYANVQFRFKIKRGSAIGTHFAYGWLIDDFQILASVKPITPPVISFISTYNDTVYNTGPFPITALVASQSSAPLDIPILKYNAFYNNTYTYDSLPMTSVTGDTIWAATIPQHVFGTKLTYSIQAFDTMGNTNFAQSWLYIKRLPPFDSNSVAMHQINTPDSIVLYNTSTPVNITIKNKGILNLTSATINWSINGVMKTPVAWTGNLLDGFNASVSLGNYTSGTYGTYDTLKIWVKLPNGKQDPIITDDTLKFKVYNCQSLFNGDYIIGNSANADYVSINSALLALKNSDCIRGDVCLKIENGTYTQNIDLTNYANYLGSYSLTITSLANHKDSVILKDPAGVLITLNNTNNFFLKNITLDVALQGTYAIQFTGNANNIEIRNCNIFANPNALTDIYAGIIKEEINTGIINNIKIINNRIDGGCSSILLYDGNISNYGTNNIIDSNICINFHAFGINCQLSNTNSISYNTVISRNTTTTQDCYGIYIKNATISTFIGNKIYIPRTTVRLFGLYLYDVNSKISTRAFIANNEIRVNANGSSAYAVYTHTTKLEFYHNSIYMTTTTGGGCGLHIYSSNDIIKNNTITCDSLQTPILSSGSIITSDYNNLYGGSFNLTSWRNSSGQDANSISIQSQFINPAINLKLSDYNPFKCPRLAGVLTDINNSHRTSLTTMGAYSVPFWEGYNLEINAIISPVSLNGAECNSSDFSPVQISVRNSGSDTIWLNANPLRLSVIISGAINFQKDTLINIGHLTIGEIDTFTITHLLPTSLNGNYNIIAFLQCNIDTIHSDDTLRSTYVVSKIVLPYDINFNSYPPEMMVKTISGNIRWNVVSGVGTNPVIAPAYGNGRLEFQGSLETGSLSQAILSGIDLTTSIQPRLGFWYAHDNVYSRDLMLVKISTDEGLTSTLLISVELFDPSITSPCWKYHEIDLSYYANKNCVTILFEASSFGGGNQSIDRIRLSGYSDLNLSLLLPDFNNVHNCNFSNLPLKVILDNVTKQNIIFNNNSKIKVLVRGADSVNYTYALSPTDILYGNTSDTLIIDPQFDFISSAVYNFTAYINTVDSNTANDTDKVTFSIHPDIALDSLKGVNQTICKYVGDSVFVTVYLKNNGNAILNNIPLRLTINKNIELFDTLRSSLNPGDTMHYTFTKPYIVPLATFVQPYYTFSVKTEYPCDADTNNNKIEFLACVNLDPKIDISILEIRRPKTDNCDSGRTHVYAKVFLENKGNVDMVNIKIHLSVDSADVQTYSFYDTIASIIAYTSLEFEFSNPYVVPNMINSQTTYQVNAFLEFISDDINPNNDTAITMACAIYNNVSIENITTNKWFIGQNIPNPATNTTLIPYAIPQDGILFFQLMSVNGQLLLEKEIHAKSGNHFFEINIQSISNGIYYYNVIYKGERLVKKMTIQK